MVTMETDSRAARPSPFPTVVQFLLVFMVNDWATRQVKEWLEAVRGKARLEMMSVTILKYCQLKISISI